MILLYILIGLLTNMLVGLFVIATIDDQKESLRFWICSEMLPAGRFVVLQLWPLVLWSWVFSRRSK